MLTHNEQAILNDYITSEEIEDAYIELVAEYKKLSKRFTTLKKEHASFSSIYENILREKNELLAKTVELQTENDDLKIRLKKFIDVASTSSTIHVPNQADRTRSGPGRIPSYQQQIGRSHPTSKDIMIFIIIHITTMLQI